MVAWTQPTASEFKTFFARDFNFAPSNDPNNLDYVTDVDVQRALDTARINFNPALFGENAQITTVFMYLSGFFLVKAIQVSAKGLSSQSKFPISSQSCGGVNVSYQIPDRYSKDEYLSQFTDNGYGMLYLSMALPMLVGNVANIGGMTTTNDGGYYRGR
ncbi:MAG: hypothetical protein WCN95_16205 [bacterium]